ncbi:TAD2B-like protein [Mya arenaria]|uniref:TAD2B-like protein n=1 Tax=Mya arenaria TaxID=6604 RepID=A0ABY7FIR5_MYAAR|nr:TAD2B-like protein [Mya arenaria]WAR20646.1 TAD2B-like protein [Mya arenaria]
MSVFECNNCQSEIKGHGIKCLDCQNIDLCLQCFSLGAEVANHRSDHQYSISTGPVVGAFSCEVPWTLAEETMLLDAVEQFGFGNWEDVANHVESKSPEQSEYHYNSYYIKGNVGKATYQFDPTPKVTDHTCPDGPLSPSISTPVHPVDLSLPEQHALGYMPLRDDFEREYDNDAETLVSSLMVNYDDDDLDIERDRRKQFARDYGLITECAQAAAVTLAAATPGVKLAKSPHPKSPAVKKKQAKWDSDLEETMKPFAQCHSCKEHEEFLENHQKEKELKARIKELIHLRKNGITKLEELEKFEEERMKRDKKKDTKFKKLTNFPPQKRHSTGSKNTTAGSENFDILIDENEKPLCSGWSNSGDEDWKVVREMSHCPGYDLLSSTEKKLCNSIGMTPANYMTVKTCIVKDYLQRRNGFPVKLRYPSDQDKTHRRRIMSFLEDNGWIGHC